MRWIYGRYVITSSLTSVINNNTGVSRKVHFNTVSLFIDSPGFHCASTWDEIDTRDQHETNKIHASSIGTVISNMNIIHILEIVMTEDSWFNQIVAKLLLERVYRLGIFNLIWYGIPQFYSMYFYAAFSDINHPIRNMEFLWVASVMIVKITICMK